jgi:hypothetical protein
MQAAIFQGRPPVLIVIARTELMTGHVLAPSV